MDIETCITSRGFNPSNISRIYHGVDHVCRCGCMGRYFEKGTVGFTRALNAMKKDSFKPLTKSDYYCPRSGGQFISEGIECSDKYINIPYDGYNDKCYTIYFKD